MVKDLALESFWPKFGSIKNVRAAKATGKTGSFRTFLAYGLIAANVTVFLSYVYGVNQAASRGYEITQLQQQVAGLNTVNKQLSLKVSEAESLVGIQNDFTAMGYLPAGTPQFLSAPQFSVLGTPGAQ